jgi:hypothetical protein
MADPYEQDDVRDYQHRFFARLAALTSPYALLSFLIQSPSFCSPRPRLVAVLTSGHGLDLQFQKSGFRLQVLRKLGLPRGLKRLITATNYVQPPQLKILDTPESAAEKCWAHLYEQCKPPTVCPKDMPGMPADQAARAEWLETRLDPKEQSSARKSLSQPITPIIRRTRG